MGFLDEVNKFFKGSEGKYKQVSNLTPQQLRIQKNLESAAKGRGAGGAFGETADYWRDLLSNNPEAFAAFEAPEQRKFQEQIIPDLAEQFAGMGSGGLSSSGFRNAAVGAGTDLSERLAAMRAGLRQNAAQNLSSLSQSALNPHAQYQQTEAPTQGFLSKAIGALPAAAMGFATGGPAGAALAGGSSLLSNNQSFGTTSPYGNQYQGSFGKLPNFGQGI